MRNPRSPILLEEVITSRKATFIDRCRREQEAPGSNGRLINVEWMRFKSQIGAGLDTRGNILMIPFGNFTVVGLLKTEQFSTRE